MSKKTDNSNKGHVSEKPVDELGMNEYVQYKMYGEKEEYLDSLASRLSQVKMEGKMFSPSELIGKDLNKAQEIFPDIKQFSSDIQSEILIELAYLRSDIYQQRCLKTLGYEHESDLTSGDRKTFDLMVAKGKMAYNEIKFNETDDFFTSRYEYNEDENTPASIYISSGKKSVSSPLKDLNVVTHEIAHHIYNGISSDNVINPEYELYGKPDSPINQLDKEKINQEILIKLSQGIYETPEAKKLIKDIPNEEDRKTVKEAIKGLYSIGANEENNDILELSISHDNLSYERAADVHATRMLLFREGICNPFTKDTVTKENIEELLKRHPYTRIQEFWNQDRSAYFLNNIAENTENNNKRETNISHLRDMAASRFELKTNEDEQQISVGLKV